MAYTINKFNGQPLIVLEDGTIDTSTSLGLVGKNYVGYGETQNENFVFLLENFANDEPPTRPLKGQLWFNTANNLSYVYDGTSWGLVGSAVVSATAPTAPSLGSLWLNSLTNSLQIWTGSVWTFIGPEHVPGFGITRARSVALKDSNGSDRPVIFLETNGTVIAICTSTAFTIDPNNGVPGFTNNLISGINLSSNSKINGSITGSAGSADKLLTPRLINGVSFTGESDINLKATTTNRLIKGQYLTGTNFDGSNEVTWSVDASSANILGKVVVRNSEGGFAAGTITANLVGNVVGDINSSGTSNFNTVTANQFIGASLTGNAFSATKLQTGRRINDVVFDGTRDITVTSSAESLTGTFLNPLVTTSSLNTVGTLTSLFVADLGVSVGGGNQLRLLVDAGIPTIRSITGELNFDIGPSGPDVSFITRNTSQTLSGVNAPAIIGDNTTNLGIPGYQFDTVYANSLKGNADTATLSTSANNLVGGSTGALPYQTSAGTTAFLNIGADGYVLKSRPGNTLQWEALSFESLTKGTYVNLINTATSASINSYSSTIPATISVDATATNTANKVVARDASGNFAAGTVTASLVGNVTGNVSGNATTATRLQTPRTINGVEFDGTQNIVVEASDPNSGAPVGAILYYPASTIPVGWMQCNGASLSTTTFALLFSKIGYNFGGSGGTFRLPDLRGEFIRSWDGGRGVDFGRGVGSFQDDSLKSHTHTYVEWYGNNNVDGPDSTTVRSGDITTRVGTTSATGGSETRPRNIALVACIKVFGEIDEPDQISAAAVINSIAAIPRYQVVSGASSAVGFTNQVGAFRDDSNYFDVYPPVGKSMANLVAFIPSVNYIAFAGGVNADDSMRCTWTALGDRIRVYVQNTEQRDRPAANYMAIWS
jgi:microcystin-dependent protein